MDYFTNLAYTYDSSSYGGSTYETSNASNTGGATTTTGTATGGTRVAGKGALTNTGFDILAATTLACVIIFVSLMVRFWKRPAPQTVTD